jgi:4-alpha-glucanotransferase
MDDALRELARAAGIATDWVDAAERPQRVGIETLRGVLDALGYPAGTAAEIAESRERLRRDGERRRAFMTATAGMPIRLPGQAARAELVLEDGTPQDLSDGAAIDTPGYHRLRAGGDEITLAVAPPRCVTVDDIAPGERLYGVAVQLYGLRRKGDHGAGDAGTLADFAAAAAREGADAIALSPAHSLFAADPGHYSPYSPSSRLFLNPLYADPALVFDASAVNALASAAKPNALIDWPAAADAKLALLRRLFASFVEQPSPALAADFAAFRHDGGERLHEHALFEALHQHWFGAPDPKWHFAEWPEGWRAPHDAEVARFAAAQAALIEFHLFAQWLVARSFTAVQRRARDAGMRIGLIADLAIGMSPGGSHAWSRQQDLLPGLNVGAPPDLFNTRGQDWGLTAFSPSALTAHGFEPFLATLRAAMRHAGGVRIDHVMGLARLWVIPQGAPPGDGAYITYPVVDMLRLLALESQRHRAIVIGEDLGTVEPEFRKRLSAAGIAGMDVLWFQRDGDAFMRPPTWRRDAVAMTTTHDLPTVAGWWSGHDIRTRAALGLVPDRKRELKARARDRAALWSAFRKSKVVAADAPQPRATGPVIDAALAFTARSPAPLALIPLEDVLGLKEQPNVPGTIDEHPNWRRRLAAPAATILDAPPVRARLATLRKRGS